MSTNQTKPSSTYLNLNMAEVHNRVFDLLKMMMSRHKLPSVTMFGKVTCVTLADLDADILALHPMQMFDYR
jgi:hypothetical protein